MKKLLIILVVACVSVFTTTLVRAEDPQSTMYTLNEIYYYLTEGVLPSEQRPGLEPTEGTPGEDVAGYTVSLQQILEDIKVLHDMCNLTPEDFTYENTIEFEGKIFFSTQSSTWGPYEVTVPHDPWYIQYGPEGEDLVVQIGSTYFAKWTDTEGTAFNVQKNWDEADSWASQLDYLGKDDWRLPNITELRNACWNRSLLGAYSLGEGANAGYWSSSVGSSAGYHWMNIFRDDCYICSFYSIGKYVRAVRTSMYPNP